MVELEHARELLETMGLHTASELLDAQLERSAGAEDTYVHFLDELLSLEYTERKRRSEETRIKLSRLPCRKTLEEFDFAFQPSIDKRQIDELATLAFAARAENVILLGPPGVGKTHLAVGLAMKALEAGMVVYYASLAHLIADLKKASEQGRLEKRWRVYLRPDILIIDEVGYLQLNRQEAELLFRLISERYERGSIILTSNKGTSDLIIVIATTTATIWYNKRKSNGGAEYETRNIYRHRIQLPEKENQARRVSGNHG